MKKIAIAGMLASMIIAVTTGCKKNDNGPVAAVDSGQVALHIHTYLGDTEADGYNINYTLSDGRKISLSLAQFYISDIRLIKTDGTEYAIPGKMLLKTFEEESYSIGSVPVGTYKAIKFHIGLDDATNQLQPTVNTLLNHPEMWFSSTAQPDGYVFLNAQGKIDTTTDASGTAAQMQPFIYKIGTSVHYVQVTMPDHDPAYTITKGNTEYMHMYFDYGSLFSGVQLNNAANLTINSKAGNSSAISNTVANNIANGFRYEE